MYEIVGRPPEKSVYWKAFFFISYPKHILWVLKRAASEILRLNKGCYLSFLPIFQKNGNNKVFFSIVIMIIPETIKL